MGELLFALGMLVIFGVFYFGVGEIEIGRSVDPIGAAAVPRVVVILGIVLIVAVLIPLIKKLLSRQTEKGNKLSVKTLALLGMLVAFLLLLDYVGFYLCALVLFFVLTLMLGNKSYLKSAATALITATVFAVLFGRILSVPLPRGEGIFRILSHYLF